MDAGRGIHDESDSGPRAGCLPSLKQLPQVEVADSSHRRLIAKMFCFPGQYIIGFQSEPSMIFQYISNSLPELRTLSARVWIVGCILGSSGDEPEEENLLD